VSKTKPPRALPDIVRLADLALRHDVKGGARRVFGTEATHGTGIDPSRGKAQPAKDRPDKSGRTPSKRRS
jgi:hypothetical protein